MLHATNHATSTTVVQTASQNERQLAAQNLRAEHCITSRVHQSVPKSRCQPYVFGVSNSPNHSIRNRTFQIRICCPVPYSFIMNVHPCNVVAVKKTTCAAVVEMYWCSACCAPFLTSYRVTVQSGRALGIYITTTRPDAAQRRRRSIGQHTTCGTELPH